MKKTAEISNGAANDNVVVAKQQSA
jgi:hypothetical protein